MHMAIVDYTLPALFTPITLFPLLGNVAYRQLARGGPSYGHMQHAQSIW